MQTLRIVTDAAALKTFRRSVTPAPDPISYDEAELDSDSDMDSLFDEPEPMLDSPSDFLEGEHHYLLKWAEPPRPIGLRPAMRTAPPVQGLYFDPFTRIPDDLAEALLQKCIDTYFTGEGVNQVMLFERLVMDCVGDTPSTGSVSSSSGIPSFLSDLLTTLSDNLHPHLPAATHALLFPPPGSPSKARQVIINFYNPGEGITPHVDLLDRFGDGIIGVSLGSGCVMQFVKAPSRTDADVDKDGERATWDVFLPHGSVYVMSEEARYGWTHGIDGRREDWVQQSVGSENGRWVMRSIRVSITFRWLLPGADVVGGSAAPMSHY